MQNIDLPPAVLEATNMRSVDDRYPACITVSDSDGLEFDKCCAELNWMTFVTNSNL